MKFTKTERGFVRIDFRDLYNETCSIQESSLAEQAAIWLGCDKDRMHLSQDLAIQLIPLLQKFVDDGTLPQQPELPPGEQTVAEIQEATSK